MKKPFLTSIIFLVITLTGCINSTPFPTLAIPDSATPTPPLFPTLDPEFLSPIISPTVEETEDTIEATPIPSLTPVDNSTSAPTEIISPTSLPEPSCKYDELLINARLNLSGVTHSIFFNLTNGERNLYLWYLEDMQSETDATFSSFKTQLIEEIIRKSSQVYLSNPACIAADFSTIHTIVVAPSMQILQTGKINAAYLPNRAITEDDDLSTIINLYESSYSITSLPDVYDEGEFEGCGWETLADNVQNSFSVAAPNQGIYYLLNPDGLGTLFAQWEGAATFDDISAKLVNLIFEINCYQQPVDQIVINVIDKNASVIYIGVIESKEGIFFLTDLQTIHFEQ